MKVSAGVLPYRFAAADFELFLVHPGGPFWKNRDNGAWSIAKGEVAAGEDLLAAAKREFREETGIDIAGDFIELTPLRQPGGKLVHAWAIETDIDASGIASNMFSIEWPPRSGRQQQFAEVDRAQWFTPAAARQRLLIGQRAFVAELESRLRRRAPPDDR